MISLEELNDLLDKPLSENEKITGNYEFHYPAILEWFACQSENWDPKSIVQGSLMVYGWMPTIYEVKKTNKNRLTEQKAAEISSFLNKNTEANAPLRFVNGSLTGTSKFLHFWKPNYFAIWDSNIYKALFGKKKSYFASRKYDDEYLAYSALMRQYVGYYGGSIRQIESLLFKLGQLH